MKKAVITVIGRDSLGIIAKVSARCADCDYFAMIMLVDISRMNVPFASFADAMAELGRENALEIRAMHEDIFDAMHQI